MTKPNINRKPTQSQGDTWLDVLQDYKAQMTSKNSSRRSREHQKASGKRH